MALATSANENVVMNNNTEEMSSTAKKLNFEEHE